MRTTNLLKTLLGMQHLRVTGFTVEDGALVIEFTAGVTYRQSTCFSCAARLQKARFGRCWRCSLAWRLAYRLPVPEELAVAHDEASVVA